MGNSDWRARLVAVVIGAGSAASMVGCEAEVMQTPYNPPGAVQPLAGNGAVDPNNNLGPQPPVADNGNGVVNQPGEEQPGMNTIPAGQNPVPCAVAQTVATHCGECHSSKTNWGAPMSLVTFEDFHADAPLSKGRPVYQVAAERIIKEANPMPPSGLVAHEMIAPLSDWLAAGAPAGTAADANCMVTVPVKEDPKNEPPTNLPDNATCYQLLNHGGNTVNDTPYSVMPNETYVEFYFDVPWTEEVAAINWRTVYDRTEVLHHWLLYSGSTGAVTGPHGGSQTGTTGSHTLGGIELVAGWAVGGNDVDMPEGIAMKMPPPGSRFLIEWHFFNQTGAPVPDHSGVELCVVPKSSVDPKRLAGLTWLGTENFNGFLGMPAGLESKFGGTCTPSRKGLGPDESIKIFAWLPHMHLLGKHMETVVNRVNGTKEVVFDKPFQFDLQLSYEQDPVVELFAGDTITATCTFFNNTQASVAFGPSTTQEMCYQFTFSYPAGALENGVLSLNGSTNTCW